MTAIAIEPGVYTDMTNAAYHGSAWFGSSDIKKFVNEIPAKALHEMNNPVNATDAMKLGTAVHTLVLEPDHYHRDIAVSPEGLNLRTNAGKATLAEFIEANAGKTIIDADTNKSAHIMAANILTNPTARRLLRGGLNEASVFQLYDDGIKKHRLKVRPDSASTILPMLSDIKTCRSAKMNNMAKDIVYQGYHISAAMYLSLVNRCDAFKELTGVDRYDGFTLICVENEPPHLVACYQLTAEFLDLGHSLFLQGLANLAESQAKGYPGYPNELRFIEPPKWAFYEVGI